MSLSIRTLLARVLTNPPSSNQPCPRGLRFMNFGNLIFKSSEFSQVASSFGRFAHCISTSLVGRRRWVTIRRSIMALSWVWSSLWVVIFGGWLWVISKHLFKTSDWLLICGWYVVLLFNLVPYIWNNFVQNLLLKMQVEFVTSTMCPL